MLFVPFLWVSPTDMLVSNIRSVTEKEGECKSRYFRLRDVCLYLTHFEEFLLSSLSMGLSVLKTRKTHTTRGREERDVWAFENRAYQGKLDNSFIWRQHYRESDNNVSPHLVWFVKQRIHKNFKCPIHKSSQHENHYCQRSVPKRRREKILTLTGRHCLHPIHPNWYLLIAKSVSLQSRNVENRLRTTSAVHRYVNVSRVRGEILSITTRWTGVIIRKLGVKHGSYDGIRNKTQFEKVGTQSCHRCSNHGPLLPTP